MEDLGLSPNFSKDRFHLANMSHSPSVHTENNELNAVKDELAG